MDNRTINLADNPKFVVTFRQIYIFGVLCFLAGGVVVAAGILFGKFF